MSESPLLFSSELSLASAAQPTLLTHWSLLSRGLPSKQSCLTQSLIRAARSFSGATQQAAAISSSPLALPLDSLSFNFMKQAVREGGHQPVLTCFC